MDLCYPARPSTGVWTLYVGGCSHLGKFVHLTRQVRIGALQGLSCPSSPAHARTPKMKHDSVGGLSCNAADPDACFLCTVPYSSAHTVFWRRKRDDQVFLARVGLKPPERPRQPKQGRLDDQRGPVGHRAPVSHLA